MNICFARVRFSALGGRYEKMLERCARSGIAITGLRPTDGGVTGFMPARSYRSAAKIARTCRTRLQVQKRCGLWFRLWHFRGRWGLLAAPAVFLVLVSLLGRMVWAVQWQGTPPELRPEIRAALYSMDICEGTILTQEKIRSCEKELVDRVSGLAWASLNFAKGRLVVETSQAREKPPVENNDPVDLVAAADGIVLDVHAEEGTLLKKPGQTIAEGEVLISAGRCDRDDCKIPFHAKGSVIARVEKIYACVQPMTLQEELPAGQPESRKILRILDRRLGLTREAGDIPPEAKIICRPLTVWGFALPATIEEAVWLKTEQKTTVLTREQAEQRARLACLEELYRAFPDARILTQQQECKIKENQLYYQLKLQYTANVAKTRMYEKS